MLIIVQKLKNPNKELVVSNTEKFVKIMFRSPMMFVTNSITPTPSARAEIQRMIPVFRKYPKYDYSDCGSHR